MRIAVIAAPNPGYVNPGMLTVDLAAAAFLERAVPNAVLSWYTLHPPGQFTDIHSYLDPSDLPFDWLPLVDHFDDVCGHDAILLWGDFLQARHYFIQDAVERLILGSRQSLSPEQALKVLHRCLLFSEAPLKVLTKVVVFGSTILFNRQADYGADCYGQYVSRLFRHCAGAWMREPVSAAKVQHMRQDYDTTVLGTDAAFLLREDDLTCLSTTSWLDGPPFEDRVGVFFSARTRPPQGLMPFLRQVTRPLGLHLEWLPWFPVHEWLRRVPRKRWVNPVIAAYVLASRHRIDRLMSRGTSYSAGDILAAIARYRLIITDTYHLCVNAWRVGTPALCIGSSDAASKHYSLDDYKKRVLYEMYDASDFYFTSTSIRAKAAGTPAVDRALAVIADDSLAMTIADRIRVHARSVERALAERLSAIAAT